MAKKNSVKRKKTSSSTDHQNSNDKKRWWSLYILCLGVLMIVLDTTIVNVALPSIKADLAFTETSLVWVVNAYMLTFSGFLLLGGRLGDLFGHRKLFLTGITLFTLASLCCGLANSQAFLITARAIQGLGGAVVSAVALSIIMDLFRENERAKAMGIFGFVTAGGGSIGVFLGGLLTGTFDWHWIFLVNIPIGIAVFFLCLSLVPKDHSVSKKTHLDMGGAITVTLSLMLAVYAIVNGNGKGWLSLQTLGMLGAAVILFVIFLLIEGKISSPLVPLGLFRSRNLSTANVIGILWSASMFAWFFLSALYLQLVLGYTPLQVGLSFLPANLLMAAFSVGLSAKVVDRFGIKKPLMLGMMLVALGLVLFSMAPMNGNFLLHVFPGMLLLGLGAGLGFNPVLLAAMNDVSPEDSGLASGVINTAFMMGGALGLAVLASLASWRTTTLLTNGVDQIHSLLSGYHVAFIVGAAFAISASVLCAVFLTTSKNKHKPQSFH